MRGRGCQKEAQGKKKCTVSCSSSSDTKNNEPIRKVPKTQRPERNEKSEAAKDPAKIPTQSWHNNHVPLNKLASLPLSRTSQLQDVTEVDNQIRH